MAIVSDKTQKYLDMLEDKFDINNFYEFIKDLLNLENSNIVNGKEQKATTEQYKHYINTTQLYAKYEDNNRRNIGVIIIRLQDNKHPANARTLQRNYIAHLLLEAYSLDAAITAIYSNTDDTWRLSFVKQELKIEVGKLKTVVSSAKRYSYLFGKDEPNHTAKEQLLELLENNNKQYSIEEIEEKFSVEKVTKDFFEKYKENYLKLKEILEKNEEFISEANRCDFTAEEFTKKLMGQIVFLYFLQKKGWLGVRLVPQNLSYEDYNKIYEKLDVLQKKVLDRYYISFNGTKKIKKDLLERFGENKQDVETLSDIFVNTQFDNKWGTGEKRFIRTIFNNCKNRNKNFFDDYLEPFFYNGLNLKRKNQYFSLFNCKIPFLNGGLFEPLDNYKWEIARFNIENDIFSNDEKSGILDFFDRYNFTMNEEEPLEKDVAVDPEMLGKIFENLLDVKDRKSKGAFYTPREIVHYMCQESLANFLVNKVGVDYEEIKEFIQYGEMIRDEDLKGATKDSYLVGKTVFENITQIDEALKNIKIADPSVGSGAFPLGILNEIVKIRDILTSYMLLYNKLGLYDKKYSEETITNRRNIYNIKWNTIKNSIYAVDIENSAVDITKLRLWLSIVVDQVEVPVSGPEPLPNLDFKIMQGNSLIDEYKGIKLIDKKFIDELKDRDNVKLNDIERVKVKNRFVNVEDNQISFGDGIKKAQIDRLIDLKRELYGTNDSGRKKEILAEIQRVRSYLLELNFAGTNLKNELFEIDKSHNKPYFAWMLEFIEVFIENNGFDIVIGNPPYVGEKGNKEIFRAIAKTDFGKKYYCGKMDLFYFFFHKGIDISKNQGIISFITTNYYITANGGKILRQDFYNRTNVKKLINFGDYRIFESALGQHNMITILEKNIENKNYPTKIINTNRKGFMGNQILSNILNAYDKKETEYYKLSKKDLYEANDHYIRLYNNSENGKEEILNRIQQNNPILSELCNISSGADITISRITQKHIKSFGNNYEFGSGVFVVDNIEIEEMNLNNDEKYIIKDFIKNSNICKYGYELYNEKLIYLNWEDNIELYPNIKKHLEKYKIILEDQAERYSEHYPWFALHRPRELSIFEATEKIIVPYRTKSNIFGYAQKPVFASRDVFYITRKKEISLKYVLGLLNSKVYLYWLINKGKRKGEILELYGTPLSEIPIKLIDNKDILNSIEYKVTELIDLKRMNFGADISKLQEEMDKIVYKIFDFNNEEIEIIERECSKYC